MIGPALIFLAAFVSEFLFLLPFDIDYSFFIGTVEAVPLFIRNLAFILMVCVGAFLTFCILLVLQQTSGSVWQLFKRTWRIKNRQILAGLSASITRVWLSQRDVSKQLKVVNANRTRNKETLDDLSTSPTELYLKYQSGYGAVLQYVALRFVVEKLCPRIPVFGKSLGGWIEQWKEKRRSAQQQAVVSTWAIDKELELQKRQTELEIEEDNLKEKVDNLATEISGLYNDIRTNRDSYIRQFFQLIQKIIEKYSDAFHSEFLAQFPPKFMTDRKWAPVSLVLIVLVIPPVMRYLDGRTMVDCARSLMGPQAMMAAQVCPTDGSADWLTHVGIDVNQLSGGDVKTESSEGEAAADQELQEKANYVFHRLVEDWWPPKEDKAEGITTELRAALRNHYEPYLNELVREAQGSIPWRWFRAGYRYVFGFLREYSPIAHNYPIVTLTFESSPAIFRTDAATGGLQTLCRPDVNKPQDQSAPIKVRDAAADWTLAKFVASLSSDDACQLVDGTTSTRMLYLGEAGAWTLLYSLGPDGAPILFKTKDLSSISYKPVAIRRPSVPERSSPGVTVNVGPIDVHSGPIEATLKADSELGNLIQSIGEISSQTAAILDNFQTHNKDLSDGIEDLKTALIGPEESLRREIGSISEWMKKSHSELVRLRDYLSSEFKNLPVRLTDLSPSLASDLSKFDSNLTNLITLMKEQQLRKLEDIIVGVDGLQFQIGKPESKSDPYSNWEGVGGQPSDPTGKLENMPSDAAGSGTLPSASEAKASEEAAGDANNVFRLITRTNEHLVTVISILEGRPWGNSAPSTLDIPAIFIGVEKRINDKCLEGKVFGEFSFERYKPDMPVADVKAGMPDLLKAIKTKIDDLDRLEEETDESKLLLILIEGTADTTDSPARNREISEARATFIHEQLEEALKDDGINPGKDEIKRVVIASYGTGEWSHRSKSDENQSGVSTQADATEFYKPRSALIRLCHTPVSDESLQDELAAIEESAIQQNAQPPAD